MQVRELPEQAANGRGAAEPAPAVPALGDGARADAGPRRLRRRQPFPQDLPGRLVSAHHRHLVSPHTTCTLYTLPPTPLMSTAHPFGLHSPLSSHVFSVLTSHLLVYTL